jgi:hypothetical protein
MTNGNQLNPHLVSIRVAFAAYGVKTLAEYIYAVEHRQPAQPVRVRMQHGAVETFGASLAIDAIMRGGATLLDESNV